MTRFRVQVQGAGSGSGCRFRIIQIQIQLRYSADATLYAICHMLWLAVQLYADAQCTRWPHGGGGMTMIITLIHMAADAGPADTDAC
jgi:hypothetical protein